MATVVKDSGSLERGEDEAVERVAREAFDGRPLETDSDVDVVYFSTHRTFGKGSRRSS